MSESEMRLAPRPNRNSRSRRKRVQFLNPGSRRPSNFVHTGGYSVRPTEYGSPENSGHRYGPERFPSSNRSPQIAERYAAVTAAVNRAETPQGSWYSRKMARELTDEWQRTHGQSWPKPIEHPTCLELAVMLHSFTEICNSTAYDSVHQENKWECFKEFARTVAQKGPRSCEKLKVLKDTK